MWDKRAGNLRLGAPLLVQLTPFTSHQSLDALAHTETGAAPVEQMR